MSAATGLRYIDSDGHILEPPTALPEYAPAEFRDRIWHIETDGAGEEWLVYDRERIPANFLSAAGVAGMSDEDRARSFRGEMRYSETRPAGWNAKARLEDMDEDHIDLAVLYPTNLLGLQSLTDVRFGLAQTYTPSSAMKKSMRYSILAETWKPTRPPMGVQASPEPAKFRVTV